MTQRTERMLLISGWSFIMLTGLVIINKPIPKEGPLAEIALQLFWRDNPWGVVTCAAIFTGIIIAVCFTPNPQQK